VFYCGLLSILFDFEKFCWVCTGGLEVIFSYEFFYFNAVVMCRNNDYRISFIILGNDSFIAFFCMGVKIGPSH
jgi:hypothetical protein